MVCQTGPLDISRTSWDRTLQIINIAWYLRMTAEPTWANTLRGRWFAYERP